MCGCPADAVTGARGLNPECRVHGPCPYRLFHRYSEASARAKLTRHRERGDATPYAFGCPGTGHWHIVTDPDPSESDAVGDEATYSDEQEGAT
jgi:hypothetical protein